MNEDGSAFHDGRRSRSGTSSNHGLLGEYSGHSSHSHSSSDRGRDRASRGYGVRRGSISDGSGGGRDRGSGFDTSRQGRLQGRHQQQRLSLKVSSSSTPSMDEPKAHIDPLAYQQRGLSDPGALPIAQGRVVGYDPSGTRRSGSSSHGSGYSFDAVAAKIARNESPSPEDHPEGPPLNQGRQGQTPVVEIAPGVYHRLRGAAETWECVERDFYMPVSCFACAAELCCIQDASYVLCPTCRVVSPMDGMSADHDGGVGLGFTMDDLCRWQSEILAKRNHQGAGQQQQHYYQRRRASGHHTSQF